MLEAEAEDKSSRPRPRPRPKIWPRGQLVLEDLTSLRNPEKEVKSGPKLHTRNANENPYMKQIKLTTFTYVAGHYECVKYSTVT